MSDIRNYYNSNPRFRPNEERLQRYEYILENRATSSLREIGAHLGISAERVRQLEEFLVEKLSGQTTKNAH